MYTLFASSWPEGELARPLASLLERMTLSIVPHTLAEKTLTTTGHSEQRLFHPRG